MTGRGGQLPWGTRRPGMTYGNRGGGAGRVVLLGLILVATFALAYFALTRACGGSKCEEAYCASDEQIATPEGYQRVTRIYAYNQAKGAVPEGNNVQIQLELEEPTTDSRNLSFYRYVPDTKIWEPMTPAVLDAQGKHVSATLNSAPPVLAVMRRLSAAGHVVAYLPPKNAPIHPEAAAHATIVHTRDFKPTSDGGLAGTPAQVQVPPGAAWYPMVSVDANEKGLIPIVTTILSNSTSRSNHVQQILKKVQDLGLAGIDISYMDLPVDQRTSFTLFVSELATALHAQNKMLTLTLPSPLKTPERVDEGAYDWAELGKAADVLQIWPYRDQGTFRRDMPDILKQLTGEVDPNKLVLTVSPYAVEKSTEGLRTMTLTEAMIIATKLGISGDEKGLTTNTIVQITGINIDRDENRSGIKWSPEAASVAFTYQQNGGRTVWIENAFSIGFKLELIPQFKLGGVAVEDATADTLLGNIWTALTPFITSGQPVLLQPNPQDLQPRWKASKGTTEGGARGSVKWTTPAEPGTYTVSVTLSDGVALFENAIPVAVVAKATPVASPTAGR